MSEILYTTIKCNTCNPLLVVHSALTKINTMFTGHCGNATQVTKLSISTTVLRNVRNT